MTALFSSADCWEEAEGVVGVIGSTTCNLIAVTSLQFKLRRSRKLQSLRSLQLHLLPHVGTFPLLVQVIPWEVPELNLQHSGPAAGEPSVAKASVGEPGNGGSESVSQIRNVT